MTNIERVASYRHAEYTRVFPSSRMDFIWFLLVGLIAGFLAGKIMKGSGFGMIGDIVVGIIGSFVGGFLFSLVGLSAYGTVGSIVMAVIGAVVFLAIVKMIKRK